MWAFISSALVAIFTSWIGLSITGAVVAVLALYWDEWGKELVGLVGAALCIAGVIYLTMAATMSTFVYTQADIICAIAMVAFGAVVGWDTLIDMANDIVQFATDAFTTFVGGVTDAFPWLKYIMYGAVAYGAFRLVSGDGDNGGVVYSDADFVEDKPTPLPAVAPVPVTAPVQQVLPATSAAVPGNTITQGV